MKFKDKTFSVSQDIDGKGKGFISSRTIKPGELICKEKAAFVLRRTEIDKENVSRKYAGLSRDKQRLFSDLKAKEAGGEVCDIFLNNAINTDEDQFGIFLTIARVNHSCSPNAGNQTQNDV